MTYVPPALIWDELTGFAPHFVGVLVFLLHVFASAHAILHKRDVRAAIGWVAVIWLLPIGGPILYIWLGINRIRRKARILRAGQTLTVRPPPSSVVSEEELKEYLGPRKFYLRKLAKSVAEITSLPLMEGNNVEPLVDSDNAYPAMLKAIDEAEQSISLCTYIFDYVGVGKQFVEALGKAVERGVEVRVLIDDIGARYHFPPVDRPLRKLGVKTARFIPTLVPFWVPYSNLRTHRKILVVDGRVGFTGGMNIRDVKLHDLHFRLTGPIVGQLQQVFVDDWAFSTEEVLAGEKWFPKLRKTGTVMARGVSDGPDEDFEKLRMTYLSALACAQTRVTIMTPYFLPDPALITSLNVAALRGVEVDIFLPRKNNLAWVQWACTAQLGQVIERGCRVWYTPPPFDHTKLMIVDRTWVLLGSGNWDPRSLRLNFEFNVECYDRELALNLDATAKEKLALSHQVTLDDLETRSLPVKLRDGIARLFSPYL